jgi:riboflavin transporter 2
MATKTVVWLASLLFGLSSWIAVSGLWLELPVLINRLPEKWALASQLTIAIQSANIIVFLFCALKHLQSQWFNDVSATNFQLFLGVWACLALIFGWDTQTMLFGANRSIVLLTSTFCLAIIDCLSSVTFLPFIGRFSGQYLIPFLIGEGKCNIL